MFAFLIHNIFVVLIGNRVFQQSVGIPHGYQMHFIVNRPISIFIFFYEAEFIQRLVNEKRNHSLWPSCLHMCVTGKSLKQMLLLLLIILFSNISNQIVLFATSHFFKEIAIIYFTSFVNKWEICLHNNELLPLYLSFNLNFNIQIIINHSN